MMEEEAVKKALPSALFNKLQQKRQLEEVEAAGLEDLEKCPACNYATIIPDAGVKVLVCGNPECGKETCRECREESHTPLACNEVERDEEVGDRFRIFMKKSVYLAKMSKMGNNSGEGKDRAGECGNGGNDQTVRKLQEQVYA